MLAQPNNSGSNSTYNKSYYVSTDYTYNQTKNPEVFISVNKSRKKYYKDNVYLNSNDEFEIEIFNTNKFTIGFTVKIGDKKISNSVIVLYPGQRILLERYIDENKKFKFITYTVENNKQSLEAIQDNGKLQIDFYKEKTVINYPKFQPQFEINQPDNFGPFYYTNQSAPIIGNNSTISDNKIFGSNSTGNLNNQSYFTSFDNLNRELNSEPLNAESFFTNFDDNFKCFKDDSHEFNLNEFNAFVNDINTKFKSPLKKETGIVGKGQESKQTFNDVNIDFEYFPFYTKHIKLLPISEKPIEAKDLVQFCTNCGCKQKREYKFCPKCGTKNI